MYDHLLQQARRLARLDPRKPRQANLRRAVSSAYYAVFHFLVDQSCRVIMGTQNRQRHYRQVLGRAFEHGTMKQTCASFGGGNLKAHVTKGLPSGFVIPDEIKRLAATFVELQTHRHLADYDLTERFDRSDVRFKIEQATTSIDEFKSLPFTDEKKFFLACLWAWKNLANR